MKQDSAKWRNGEYNNVADVKVGKGEVDRGSAVRAIRYAAGKLTFASGGQRMIIEEGCGIEEFQLGKDWAKVLEAVESIAGGLGIELVIIKRSCLEQIITGSPMDS